ncbi:MAG: DUF2652 domain-containing protein [Bradymonadia bacterium]
MRETKGFLVLADISGYTTFVRSHKMGKIPFLGQRMANTSQIHAETVITDLLETMIDSVGDALTLNKLEGDAIFFFRESAGGAEEVSALIQTLSKVFDAFNQRVHDLMFCQTCLCDCCQQMTQLKVKIFAHYGDFLIKQVAQFTELAGHDVIIAHRLMKNSVNSDEYLLLTESLVHHDPNLTSRLKLEVGVERYGEDQIKTFIHFPRFASRESNHDSWFARFRRMKAYFQIVRNRDELKLSTGQMSKP